MGKAVVFLLVGLAAMAAAKPYEPSRNPSVLNRYTIYPLYRRDIPEEYLNRIFGGRVKDAAADLPPFVQIPDELTSDQLNNVEKLLELLDPQQQPIDEKPSPDQKQPDAPVNDALAQPEKLEKPDQKPNENDQEKEKPQDGEEDKPKGEDKNEAKPDQKPNENDQGKEKPQDGKQDKPKGDDKNEAKPDKDDKRPKPDHSLIPHQPHKGKRPEMEKPHKPKDGARRGHPSAHQEGKDHQRDGRGKNPPAPPAPAPPRHPESPVVQINVNVAAPAL